MNAPVNDGWRCRWEPSRAIVEFLELADEGTDCAPDLESSALIDCADLQVSAALREHVAAGGTLTEVYAAILCGAWVVARTFNDGDEAVWSGLLNAGASAIMGDLSIGAVQGLAHAIQEAPGGWAAEVALDAVGSFTACREGDDESRLVHARQYAGDMIRRLAHLAVEGDRSAAHRAAEATYRAIVDSLAVSGARRKGAR